MYETQNLARRKSPFEPVAVDILHILLLIVGFCRAKTPVGRDHGTWGEIQGIVQVVGIRVHLREGERGGRNLTICHLHPPFHVEGVHDSPP
ncbi:hypothetical protein BO78DRAFT_213044 [Aspergillus sclerotiicarbonarius CBS 121057]|uniref:Uncharacterized protein n=1 Tax=Aspergillus sclerotiicarbonarius (strain CBS 121057 / IBT 28362) TaxID=1448318 RepID=A0A319DYJ2_ASPSB|nr:hypothetical protein BO78DRAFT_213044 [Aspergillus sclerotiicarbonarius CBS 121057]